MGPWRWAMSKVLSPPTARKSIFWCVARRCLPPSRPCLLFLTHIAANNQENFMSEVRYTDQHEWISLDGDEATVGITKYAAESLGDVVFVELPASGKTVSAGGEVAVVESVKAASDIYAP